MDTPSLTAAVRRELLAHPDVTEGSHRFGGIVFRVGRHEIGHLHGEREADLPFPPHIRSELVASGRASPDPHGSDSAFVSRTVSGAEDVAAVVELFRMSYELAAAQAARDNEEEAPQQAELEAARQNKVTWRDVLASAPILRRRARHR